MLRCQSLTQTYLSGGRPLTVLNDITFALERGLVDPITLAKMPPEEVTTGWAQQQRSR